MRETKDANRKEDKAYEFWFKRLRKCMVLGCLN